MAVVFTYWQVSISIILSTLILEFYCEEELFLPLIYSLSVILFISIWTHGCLFYSMHHNPVLSLFYFSHGPRFGHREIHQVDCCILSTCPCEFSSPPLLSGTMRCGSSCIFPVPAWNQSFLQGALVSFIGE